MNHANTAGRWLSIFILAVLPWFTACADSNQQITPPVTLPFVVDKVGDKTVIMLKVSERQTYAFELQYFFKRDDQSDRRKIWILAGGARKDEGGKWVERGAPLHISLKIVRNDGGQLQFEEDISNPRLTSWGSNSLDAKLANVLLDHGTYTVTVENLSEAPEFKGREVGIRIVRAYLGK